MYYELLTFILDQLKKYNEITNDKIVPMNGIIEKVEDFKIRPTFTYGNNTDWSNLRRDEDIILTLQIFTGHNNYLDLNEISREIKKTIIKYCCSKQFQGIYYSLENISLISSFETNYTSMSINLTYNVKEIV